MNISRALRELIKKENMTLGQVARVIGVDRSSFYRTLRDEGNPERKTIEMVLDHLGYEIRYVKLSRKVLNYGKAFKQRKERKQVG